MQFSNVNIQVEQVDHGEVFTVTVKKGNSKKNKTKQNKKQNKKTQKKQKIKTTKKKKKSWPMLQLKFF